MTTLAEKLATSIGGKLLTEHNTFAHDWNKFVELSLSELPVSKEELEKLSMTITVTAGKLHNILNEKLISLRDI